MPPPERFDHGTRSRYTSGCRCSACREANRVYNRSRVRAAFNGLVDAGRARQHLVALSGNGVGRRSVAAACDVALTVIADVRSGKKQQIRAETERRLLAVSSEAIADHATVPGGPTWRAVRELLKLGWTKGAIAQELGRKYPALQIHRRRVLARTALAVDKLLRRVRAETPEGVDDLCTSCGHSHAAANRARLIRHIADQVGADVAAAWPCFYPDFATSSASQRRLFRDVAAARRAA